MNKKQTMTRGEEEIMQILWQLGTANVNEIIACTGEPQPKYTTVATFLKILESKGFVGHTAAGKSHHYFPILAKEEYAQSDGGMHIFPKNDYFCMDFVPAQTA